ncbi:MAG: 16S rRNA (uracil(1498)-N(3))-methyltransferase [Bacteroidetes bacterium]|nr:16S rRNA (uracil(1498)-N(3))-methyltransferase [Bacteroidota bacterium]
MHLLFSATLTQPITRIEGEEHHHLHHVLRLNVGDALLLSCGDGRVAEAVIEEAGATETRCRLGVMHAAYNELPVPVTLLQGVLKNPGKVDWLVEKATELGMTDFIPLATARTISHRVKTGRLQKLVRAAAKQCLRGRIPCIHELHSLTEAMAVLAGTRLLVFHETASPDSTPESLAWDARPLAIFIGPEGGFEDDEIALLRSHGAEVLSLGPRRLRGETAGIVALARVGPAVRPIGNDGSAGK